MFGKEHFIPFTVCVIGQSVCVPHPFFRGGGRDVEFVLIPDHCLSIYFPQKHRHWNSEANGNSP